MRLAVPPAGSAHLMLFRGPATLERRSASSGCAPASRIRKRSHPDRRPAPRRDASPPRATGPPRGPRTPTSPRSANASADAVATPKPSPQMHHTVANSVATRRAWDAGAAVGPSPRSHTARDPPVAGRAPTPAPCSRRPPTRWISATRRSDSRRLFPVGSLGPLRHRLSQRTANPPRRPTAPPAPAPPRRFGTPASVSHSRSSPSTAHRRHDASARSRLGGAHRACAATRPHQRRSLADHHRRSTSVPSRSPRTLGGPAQLHQPACELDFLRVVKPRPSCLTSSSVMTRWADERVFSDLERLSRHAGRVAGSCRGRTLTRVQPPGAPNARNDQRAFCSIACRRSRRGGAVAGQGRNDDRTFACHARLESARNQEACRVGSSGRCDRSRLGFCPVPGRAAF